jgi:hypothetical protein
LCLAHSETISYGRVGDHCPEQCRETDEVKALLTLNKYLPKKDTEPVDLAASRSTCK